MNNDKKRQREIAVAKSLSMVVVSDTLCWMPVAIIGKTLRATSPGTIVK